MEKQRQRWGVEFVKLLAALAILRRSIWKNIDEFNLFFQFDRGKTASAARNLKNSAPKKMRRPLSLLLSPSYFYGTHCLQIMLDCNVLRNEYCNVHSLYSGTLRIPCIKFKFCTKNHEDCGDVLFALIFPHCSF